MSHFVVVDSIKITNLDLLREACNELGFVYDENAREARYYSGTEPCYAAIKVPGSEWDIAVRQDTDNPEHFVVACDFFGERGKAMKEAVNNLLKTYSKLTVEEWAMAEGLDLENLYEDGADIVVTVGI